MATSLLAVLLAPPTPARGQGTSAAEAEGGFERLVANAERAREEGRREDAAGLYGDAVRLRPGWAEGHWALGRLLYDLGRHEEASVHFGAVATYRPDDGIALAAKGLCEVELGNYDRALADLQRAYGLGIPDSNVLAGASLQIALLVNRLGGHDAALSLLAEFAQQGGDPPQVIIAFGLAMLRLPVLPKDATERQRAMALLAGRAAYHMARGLRPEVGRLALEELVSRYPTEPNVHYAQGLFLKGDQPTAALSAFERELEFQPDNAPAMLALATLHIQVTGDLKAARDLAARAKQIAPDSPAVYLVMGDVLQREGEVDAAITDLEHGAKLAPENPQFQYALANAYRRAGRQDAAARARAAFERLSNEQKDARSRVAPALKSVNDGDTR